MDCWDCSKRKGIKPAILTAGGEVLRVCQLCWNREWAKLMHDPTCQCPHCECQKELKS